MPVPEVCSKDTVSCGEQGPGGVQNGLSTLPERGFNVCGLVQPGAVGGTDSAEGLEAVEQLPPDTVLVGFGRARGCGAPNPRTQRGAPLTGALASPRVEPNAGLAGKQGRAVPAKGGHLSCQGPVSCSGCWAVKASRKA